MVLKRNRDWQNRSRRRNAGGQGAYKGEEIERSDNECTEKAPSGRDVMFIRMTMPQFTTLFTNGYRIALEEGMSEKDATEFGMYVVTQYLSLCAENRLAKEKKEKDAKKDDEENKDDDA
ncbi:MAG: hypothetical protein IKP58_07365 [Victivallales bacterium]|nr:hypothetical protein [Victivallales bacterium]